MKSSLTFSNRATVMIEKILRRVRGTTQILFFHFSFFFSAFLSVKDDSVVQGVINYSCEMINQSRGLRQSDVGRSHVFREARRRENESELTAWDGKFVWVWFAPEKFRPTSEKGREQTWNSSEFNGHLGWFTHAFLVFLSITPVFMFLNDMAEGNLLLEL